MRGAKEESNQKGKQCENENRNAKKN